MKGRISSALVECPALGLAWLLELPEVLFFFYTTSKMVTVYGFKGFLMLMQQEIVVCPARLQHERIAPVCLHYA